MSMRKELACLSLLLLILIELLTPCFGDGNNKEFSRFKGGVGSDQRNSQKGFKGNSGNKKHSNGDGDDDDVFGGEKRKVYTGPNPLHNR
ncbi:hypothetical protein U1Q18_013795 [Sarracenia purpurea var. burkii]